jgi:hypothetical protein
LKIGGFLSLTAVEFSFQEETVISMGEAELRFAIKDRLTLHRRSVIGREMRPALKHSSANSKN